MAWQLDSHVRATCTTETQIKPLGNHSWFDPNNNLLHFQQNDYQIVNHSPHEICNVSLSVRTYDDRSIDRGGVKEERHGALVWSINPHYIRTYHLLF